MIFFSKFNGYSRDGRRTLNFGGGGSSAPTQTSSTVTQSNIPEYARPYVENMMGATQKQLFTGTPTEGGGFDITGFQPYKAYGGTYDESGKQTSYDAGKSVSGFQPLQQQAQRGVAGLQVPWQVAGGAIGSMDVANQANVGGFQNQVGGYMSPYMQNVTDIQKREAGRQSAMQGQQQQAQATSAGALGGSRDAIMRAERERNLGMQMNDIQAQGSQAAYQSAQQQYNQNLQNQLAGYGQAASLANQGLQAQQGIYSLQNQMGQQQQSLEQQKINQAMQDYANAQQYPMMQLGSMSNMLRGLPMQATSTQQYQAQANPITQGIGLAGAGASLYNAYNTGKPGGAEGGLPSEFKYASGGITSVPRYDVGGQVMGQLQNMDDEALKHEAEQSPSPEIKRMAQAILRQRQAGMNPSPQMEGTPSVDYNANYAGGGIIAFGVGDVVKGDPSLSRSVDSGPTTLEQMASEKQAGLGALNTRLSTLQTQVADAVKSGDVKSQISLGNQINDISGKISNITKFSEGINAKPNPVELGKLAEKVMPTKVAEETPAAEAVVKPAPAVVKRGIMNPAAAKPAPVATVKPSIATVPVASADQAAVTPAATPEDQAAAAASVRYGLPEWMMKEKLATEKGLAKTDKERFDEVVQGKKDAGLDTSEARQQYMTEAMAQKANLKDEAERQKYMRMAEFFASWGSTPGNTLVAGMTALKAKIPDIISDVRDQKKALAESNKLVYDLGEASRQEKLGNWDAAVKLKEAAAARAEKFNERLTQYAYHTEAARTQATSAANVANIHGGYQIKAAEIADRSRALMQQGQLDLRQQQLIEKSAKDVNDLATRLEQISNKPGSPYAEALKIVARAQLTQDPESALKKQAVEAQKVIDDTQAKHRAQLAPAWQRTENLFKKFANSADYVSPANPYETPNVGNSSIPPDVQALLNKHLIK